MGWVRLQAALRHLCIVPVELVLVGYEEDA
jgi:hypothetical protein